MGWTWADDRRRACPPPARSSASHSSWASETSALKSRAPTTPSAPPALISRVVQHHAEYAPRLNGSSSGPAYCGRGSVPGRRP